MTSLATLFLSGVAMLLVGAAPAAAAPRADLVRDIDPGPGNSSPSFFTALGGKLMFQAREATNGWELWAVGEAPPAQGPDPSPRPLSPARIAPTISGLRITRKRFATRAPKGSRRKRNVGTEFRFDLSEAARVRITIERTIRGYRRGTSCTPRKRRGAKPRRCTLHRQTGTLRVVGKHGPNRVRFSGRGLSPARYRATAIATDADGLRSRPRRVTFTVVEP